MIADLKFIHNEEEEIDEKFIKKSQATSKKQKFAKRICNFSQPPGSTLALFLILILIMILIFFIPRLFERFRSKTRRYSPAFRKVKKLD